MASERCIYPMGSLKKAEESGILALFRYLRSERLGIAWSLTLVPTPVMAVVDAIGQSAHAARKGEHDKHDDRGVFDQVLAVFVFERIL